MASSTEAKTLCSTCRKAVGIFACRGCGNDFCYRHVAEHRQELNRHMDEVITQRDQLHQTIVDQEAQPNCHPLVEQIKIWEQESIDKIHRAAKNAREELLTVISMYRSKVTNELTHLTQELHKAHNEDDYVETDLKQWIEKLDKLKSDLTAAQTIGFDSDDNGRALISKIHIYDITTDFFERTDGDIQITEGGRVVLHGQMQRCGSVCGRSEYSSGKHQCRFKMEQFAGNGNFSCGVLSKTISVESLQSVYSNPLVYGHNIWYGPDTRIFRAVNSSGIAHFMGYANRIQEGDVFQLFIDCDKQMIRIINERIDQEMSLTVNSYTCPFPWQLFISLSGANDRVRLCKEKNVTPSERPN